MEGSENVQELLECFDDIPELMSKIRSNQQNKSRFQVLEPNHSFNMASVLRGNETVKASDPLYMNQVKHMASQAKRVLEHLNTTPKSPRPQKEIIRTSAERAEERLRKLRQSGIDIAKFYQQYDVERTGRVSYKDFSDTLLSLSTGISREDAIMLAASLDKNKAGSVDYKNIFSHLEHVKQTHSSQDNSIKATEMRSNSANDADSSYSAAYLASKQHAPSVNPSTYSAPSTWNSLATYENTATLGSNEAETFTLLPLPPSVYEQRSANVFSASALAPVNKAAEVTMVQRRHFYRDKHYHKAAPYFTDPTVEQQRKERKRSSSAPPTMRTMAQHVEKVLKEDGASSQLNAADRSDRVRQISLRKVLQTDAGSDRADKSKTFEQQVAQEAAPLNPLKHMMTIQSTKEKEAKELQVKFAENAVAHKMQGNIAALRYLLRQHDRSRSGFVNQEEFKAAIKKAGVPIDSKTIEALFARNSTSYGTGSVQDVSVSSGKAVSIDHFLDKIETRATAPAFAHVTGNPAIGKQTKDAEQVRIMKKVLHSLNKLSNPQKLFNDVAGHRLSYLTPNQLRESLAYAGAPLSDIEFSHLVKEIDSNQDGKISLKEFDQYIHHGVTSYEQNQAAKLKAQLLQSPKYSRSYSSSGVMNDCGVDEFHRLDQTSQTRQDQRVWEKLKTHLQVNHESVLKAFQGSKMSIPALVNQLRKQGVRLGQEDIHVLSSNVRGEEDKTGAAEVVDVVDFCSNVGIPLQYKGDDKFVSADRSAMVTDEGVFTSSRHSIASNPLYSSSIFLQSQSDLHKQTFGPRKGAGLVSLQQHLNATQPSKWWELRDSIDNPMLFPQDPSSVHFNPHGPRHPDAHSSLDLKALKRGVVSLRDQRAARSLAQLASSGNTPVGVDSRSTSTTNLHAPKRAASAPPVRGGTTGDGNIGAKNAGTSGETSAAVAAVPATGGGGLEERLGSKLSLSEKVSKWSSATLSDYFNSRHAHPQKASLNKQANAPSNPPLTIHSPGSSAGTSSVSTPTPTPRFFNTPQSKASRGSLRKHMEGVSVKSPAPYATNY
eukprot:gene22264-27226_t